MTDKKSLFDEVDFGEVWETMSAERMRIFIRKSTRKARREAVMEVLDKIEKYTGISGVGSDAADEIHRIRAKYQEVK